MAYIRAAYRDDGFCYAEGINAKKYHDEHPLSPLPEGHYWIVTPLYTTPPAPVMLTDEQIDAVLDSPRNMAYVIADKRERLRMFARDILRAAMLKGDAK
ncbi:hypothetical protein DIM56_16060 [Salmonella enterica]|nr:hypothetical protein [Salmonella enterica]